MRSFVLNLNEQNACIVTESAPSTIVEKWLDLPMLVDYAAGLDLMLFPCLGNDLRRFMERFLKVYYPQVTLKILSVVL